MKNISPVVLEDNRAIGLRQEPYSAYCRVCWYSVYKGWLGPDHHGGVCLEGQTEAHNCITACATARQSAELLEALMASRAGDERNG